MRRLLFIALIAASPAFGIVEDLRGLISQWNPSTTYPTGTLQPGLLTGTAQDRNDATQDPNLTVLICFDDPTYTTGCDTPFHNLTGHAWQYQVPNTTVGGVTPRDGNQHLMYIKMISIQNPGAGDKAIYGSPFPVKYTGGTLAQMWTANLEASPAPLAASALGVVALVGDAYSVGVSGSIVCPGVGALSGTGGATDLLSDGVAGAYIAKYSVPCANARAVTLSGIVTTPNASNWGYISQANFESQLLPTTNGFSSSIQAIALAWVNPGQVQPTTGSQGPRSISAIVAYGSFIVADWAVGNVGDSFPYNTYFNSNSKTPFTTYGIRPTMMLAGEICTPTPPSGTGCTATGSNIWAGSGTTPSSSSSNWSADAPTFIANMNASYAARGTNPTGNIYWNWSNDTSGRQNMAMAVSTLQLGSNTYGTGINGNMKGSAASNDTSGTITGTNILAWEVSTTHWTYPGTETYVSGAGLVAAETSTSAFLPQDTSNQQSPFASFLNKGFAAGYANAVEPGPLSLVKTLDLGLAMQHYTQGQSAIEALWKSVRMPWQGNFIGDPLAAAYTSAAAPGPQTTLRNVTLRGVTVQ